MNHNELREAWKEELYIEVMEDFLHCAEWAVKFEVKDKEKYYAELKEHYKKLEGFIDRLLLSQDTSKSDTIGEVIEKMSGVEIENRDGTKTVLLDKSRVLQAISDLERELKAKDIKG